MLCHIFYSTSAFWERKSAFFKVLMRKYRSRSAFQTFSGPWDSLNKSYSWTLQLPQREEGVKRQHVSVDDREEDFSVHNPGVVSNTWGTQTAAWHQRALTHPDTQAERPNTVLQQRVRAFRRSIWHKSTSSLFLGWQPVAVKGLSFILSHRAIRKGCKSPQRHLFMHRWSPLSLQLGNSHLGPPRSQLNVD